MLKALRRAYKRAKKRGGHEFNVVWAWARGHGAKRWRVVKLWSAKKLRQAKVKKDGVAFWTKKHTVYRRKYREALKRQKAGKKPRWEPWMANGKDARVTQGVKDFIARGVVGYGLFCTSLRRNFVPPGGSTTSFHLQGKAGDIAGARMSAFQHAEYQRNRGNGNCLELFGPINGEWLRGGGATGGAEGSALENLHDTHVHGAFNRSRRR